MEKKIATKNWVVALSVAAVYLLVSFAFNAWPYSWLIWVAYAVYRLVSR